MAQQRRQRQLSRFDAAGDLGDQDGAVDGQQGLRTSGAERGHDLVRVLVGNERQEGQHQARIDLGQVAGRNQDCTALARSQRSVEPNDGSSLSVVIFYALELQRRWLSPPRHEAHALDALRERGHDTGQERRAVPFHPPSENRSLDVGKPQKPGSARRSLRRSSWTGTSEPAGTRSASAGMIASPSARTMESRRFEVWSPVKTA